MSTSSTSNGRKSRLMISKMELENFKSYAGVQCVGPFHKSFSSIVGPNGSGKSNVIDALLFVFGKKANQLRLKNLAELIHKSAACPNFDYCRVSVYFQLIYDVENSEDDYELVQGSEFVITRTAFSNGGSKYKIDEKVSSFTEVGQLLRSHSVDLDNNRFLILQGEVEQIAMMKPKGATPNEDGLLEYLEDIIGSNIFVERIEAAAKLLDAINEQRVEKVNRLKSSEKERDNLVESKMEAETYLEKEKMIRRKKNVFYQLQAMMIGEGLHENEEKVTTLQEKLTKEKNKIKETEQGLHSMEKEYEKVKNDHGKVEKELNKCSTQYDSFERKDIKLQEDMKHAKVNIKKHQATLQKEGKKESDCTTEAESIHTQVAKYQHALEEFETKKIDAEAELSTIMESLQDGTADLRAGLEAAQARLADSEKAAGSLQADKDLVSNAISLVKSRQEKVVKAIHGVEEKMTTIQSSRQEEMTKLQSLKAYESKEYTPKVKAFQVKITSKRQEEEALQTKIRDLVMTVESNKAMLAAKQSQGNANKTVQAILKAAKLGGALSSAGIRGRLGDLASIDAAYDVAITTACGFLDYIVVSTAEGAQQCVEYLRRMNLGRASFIILTQMTEQYTEKMLKIVKTPENTPRLFDLIKDRVISPDLLPAFYMALRDTLVSADLDSAVRIAYVDDRAAWRVVTMDGQMIDTSGAMSGGGMEVRKGGMKIADGQQAKASKQKGGKNNSSSAAMEVDGEDDEDQEVTPALIESQKQQLTSFQAQLTDLRREKQALEEELQSLHDSFKKNQLDLEKMNMILQRFTEQEQEFTTRIATLQKESGLTAAESKELAVNESRLVELEGMISKVAPDLRSIQLEVSSLQRQILSFGGPKLAKAQAKVDGIISQIEQMSSILSTKEVEENNQRKQAEKASSAVQKASQELSKCEEKFNELTKEQKEMEEDALVVVEALKAAKETLASLEDALQEKTKVYSDMKASVQKIKAIELDLSVEIERLTHEMKDDKCAKEHWLKEAKIIRKQHMEEEREFLRTLQSVQLPAAPAAASASASAASASAMDEEDEAQQNNQQAVITMEIEELPEYTVEELKEERLDEIKREINILETERNKLKGNVNMNALLEYMRKDAAYKMRLRELEAINVQRAGVKEDYEALRRQRLEMFMGGFGQISLRLKEMYQMITLGGDAELELLDSLDPFSEGISFSVRPPKKSWKQIGNLSGGEKTLSSLALVFALHYYKPTPLYVMDEIDAALDFKNVSIVANYIKERTKDAQFIIISLRNNMFELADRLVGIYKTHDTTKSVTINPKLFESAVAGTANTLEESDENEDGGNRNNKVALKDATNRVVAK